MDTRGVIGEKPIDFTILKPNSAYEDKTATYTAEAMAIGLATYMEESQVNYKDRGVVIAYDDREESMDVARACAAILGAKGIKINMFSDNQPAVLLSYAIRYFGATSGLRIFGEKHDTYSMNVYNESGNRVIGNEMGELEHHLEQVGMTNHPKLALTTLERENVLVWINEEISNAYLDRLDRLSDKVVLKEVAKDIPIAVVTEDLATARLLNKALKRNYFKNVTFSAEGHEEGVKTADVVLETDGKELFVRVTSREHQQERLSDKALVHVLANYILSHSDKNLRHNARIVRTTMPKWEKEGEYTSSEIKIIETSPSFPYICEKIRQFDRTGETFLFGYDGRGGYLIDDFVRVKDAIQTAVVVCEMAQYYKGKHQSLLDAYRILLE